MPHGSDGRPFTIVQLSDLHCGQQFFLPTLLERAIAEVNELAPDVVVISGDLTSHGFKEEYAVAREYVDGIECASLVVIPGNHDSRNVGYVHFEELFGDRNSVLRLGGTTIVAVDSTEPDLDNGQIGRGRYGWIEEQFADDGRPPHLRAPPSPAAHPRHGPGTEHRATTRATRSSASSAQASTWCCPGTSTFPTRGGSRTSSS